jgi:hypothetical protein
MLGDRVTKNFRGQIRASDQSRRGMDLMSDHNARARSRTFQLALVANSRQQEVI